MTLEETIKTLSYVKVAYPSFTSKFSEDDQKLLVRLWFKHFEDMPYENVITAVDTIISNDTSDFAPTIAQIKAKVYELSSDNKMSQIEAFNLISNAVANGYYGAKSEFDKLPPILQKIVGNPNRLREWSDMDKSIFDTMIYKQVISQFEVLKNEEKEQALLPLSTKKQLGINTIAAIEKK